MTVTLDCVVPATGRRSRDRPAVTSQVVTTKGTKVMLQVRPRGAGLARAARPAVVRLRRLGDGGGTATACSASPITGASRSLAAAAGQATVSGVAVTGRPSCGSTGATPDGGSSALPH